MTTLLEAPTATGPTVRSTWRAHRGMLALGSLVVLVLALLALVTGVGTGGSLDPRSYEPEGAHALAALLQDQDVQVVRTEDVPTTVAGVDRRTTVFVPQPQLLSAAELTVLAGSGAPLVVVGADSEVIEALGLDTDVLDVVDVSVRDPRCDLEVAARAGRALTGGTTYRAAGGCYPAGGGSSLVRYGGVVLLGTGAPLTNDHLDEDGNAALALGLLGQGPEVRWFLPAADRDALGPVPPGSPNDLLPDWVRVGVVQLGVALLVLALWRARRLGRVVSEPLPVVVRAAETVEGRGRLYRAAGSRDTAAENLRSGARDRLTRRLGAGRAPAPEVLIELVAARTSRAAVDVHRLLYGPSPVDDAALVRLADALDALTQEVAGS